MMRFVSRCLTVALCFSLVSHDLPAAVGPIVSRPIISTPNILFAEQAITAGLLDFLHSFSRSGSLATIALTMALVQSPARLAAQTSSQTGSDPNNVQETTPKNQLNASMGLPTGRQGQVPNDAFKSSLAARRATRQVRREQLKASLIRMAPAAMLLIGVASVIYGWATGDQTAMDHVATASLFGLWGKKPTPGHVLTQMAEGLKEGPTLSSQFDALQNAVEEAFSQKQLTLDEIQTLTVDWNRRVFVPKHLIMVGTLKGFELYRIIGNSKSTQDKGEPAINIVRPITPDPSHLSELPISSYAPGEYVTIRADVIDHYYSVDLLPLLKGPLPLPHRFNSAPPYIREIVHEVLNLQHLFAVRAFRDRTEQERQAILQKSAVSYAQELLELSRLSLRSMSNPIGGEERLAQLRSMWSSDPFYSIVQILQTAVAEIGPSQTLPAKEMIADLTGGGDYMRMLRYLRTNVLLLSEKELRSQVHGRMYLPSRQTWEKNQAQTGSDPKNSTKPNLNLPDSLKTYADGKNAVSVDGGTVQEALASLIAQNPLLRLQVFDHDRNLRPYVGLYLNNDFDHEVDLNAPFNPAVDILHIVPKINGGSSDEHSELPDKVTNPETAKAVSPEVPTEDDIIAAAEEAVSDMIVIEFTQLITAQALPEEIGHTSTEAALDGFLTGYLVNEDPEKLSTDIRKTFKRVSLTEAKISAIVTRIKELASLHDRLSTFLIKAIQSGEKPKATHKRLIKEEKVSERQALDLVQGIQEALGIQMKRKAEQAASQKTKNPPASLAYWIARAIGKNHSEAAYWASHPWVGYRVEARMGYGLSILSAFIPHLYIFPILFWVAHLVPMGIAMLRGQRGPPGVGLIAQFTTLIMYSFTGLFAVATGLPTEIVLLMAIKLSSFSHDGHIRYDAAVLDDEMAREQFEKTGEISPHSGAIWPSRLVGGIAVMVSSVVLLFFWFVNPNIILSIAAGGLFLGVFLIAIGLGYSNAAHSLIWPFYTVISGRWSMLRSLRDSLDLKKGESLLEVGSSSFFPILMSRAVKDGVRYVGTDIAPMAVRINKRLASWFGQPNAEYRVAEAGVVHEGETFDKILAVNPVYLAGNRVVAQRLYAALKEGGTVIVAYDAPRSLSDLRVMKDAGFDYVGSKEILFLIGSVIPWSLGRTYEFKKMKAPVVSGSSAIERSTLSAQERHEVISNKQLRKDGEPVLFFPNGMEKVFISALRRSQFPVAVKDKDILVVPGFGMYGFALALFHAKSIVVVEKDPTTIAWLKAVRRYFGYRRETSRVTVGEIAISDDETSLKEKLPPGESRQQALFKSLEEAIKGNAPMSEAFQKAPIYFQVSDIENLSSQAQHQGRYDTVIVPMLLGVEHGVESSHEAFQIVRNLLSVLKPGGKIMILPVRNPKGAFLIQERGDGEFFRAFAESEFKYEEQPLQKGSSIIVGIVSKKPLVLILWERFRKGIVKLKTLWSTLHLRWLRRPVEHSTLRTQLPAPDLTMVRSSNPYIQDLHEKSLELFALLDHLIGYGSITNYSILDDTGERHELASLQDVKTFLESHPDTVLVVHPDLMDDIQNGTADSEEANAGRFSVIGKHSWIIHMVRLDEEKLNDIRYSGLRLAIARTMRQLDFLKEHYRDVLTYSPGALGRSPRSDPNLHDQLVAIEGYLNSVRSLVAQGNLRRARALLRLERMRLNALEKNIPQPISQKTKDIIQQIKGRMEFYVGHLEPTSRTPKTISADARISLLILHDALNQAEFSIEASESPRASFSLRHVDLGSFEGRSIFPVELDSWNVDFQIQFRDLKDRQFDGSPLSIENIQTGMVYTAEVGQEEVGGNHCAAIHFLDIPPGHYRFRVERDPAQSPPIPRPHGHPPTAGLRAA